jgi:serine/threonine protein kinase
MTLAKLIETSGSLPTTVAVARLCDVAELLMRGRPSTPLTPAHIAYNDASGSGKPRWTERGQLDPGYMAQYRAPDQNAGQTPATDVYVLGCILFETLTGKPPFRGKTVEEIVRKQTMAAAPAVRQIKVDCDLPPALEIELQRALKKRPGDRHPSAAAFAEAIRNAVREDDRSTTALDVSEAAFLHQLLQGGPAAPPHANTGRGTAPGRSAQASPPVKAVVPPTSPGMPAFAKPAVAAEAPLPQPKRTGLIVGVVVAGLLVIAGGAFLALSRGSQPVPPPKAVEPAVIAPVPPPAEPDATEAPDLPPPEPDVQPDVPPPEADAAKPKPQPVAPKPVVKPPEKKPDEKPPEKKPDPNRPPVF